MNSSSPEKEKKLQWVDLVSFDAVKQEGDLKVRCILEDGRVRFEGDEQIISDIQKGIPEYPSGTVITPADGLRFLNALGREFRSAYFFATDVRQGDVLTPYETPPLKKITE